MPSMEEWMSCGTMGVTLNTIAETTVDATFRKIEAFTNSSGTNNLTVDTVANTMTVLKTGKFSFIGTAKFDGANKTFEIALFINGIDVGFKMSDRADGDAALSSTFQLNSGDIVDARQRSTDGGASLTITSMTMSLQRLT